METALGRPVTFTVFVTLFVTTFVIHDVTGVPQCHQKQTSDGVLRFEETSNYEFAIETLFKDLSCYAENFCTITWMKDGRPIDKLLEESLLNHGQVVRFKSVKQKDAGVYTCIASRSNGKSIQQDINFNVIKDCNKNLPPINIQSPGCTNATADMGNNFTFHCEYFVGDYDHPSPTENWLKFNNSAGLNVSLDVQDNWLYLPSLPEDLDKQGTVYTFSSYFAKMKGDDTSSCKCGCKPIFGVKLEIRNVSDFAYGMYALIINSDGVDSSWNWLRLSPAVPTPRPKVDIRDVNRIFTIPGACVVLFIIVVAVVWRRFRTDIKLLYKDHWTVTSEDGMKAYDVYLSYDWNSDTDRIFAMKLGRYLEKKGYRVFCQINCLPGGDTEEDIVKALETSWRSVIIFSPDYLASCRNLDVIFSMDQAKHYKKEIIPIIYRDISNGREEHQSTLVRHVLSSRCIRFDQITSHPPNAVKKIVQKVLGDPRSEQSLHKELLLRLPPQHLTPHVPPSTPSEVNLTTTEIQPYISSRNSMTEYIEGQRQVYGDQNPNGPLFVAFEPGQNTQRLYPIISEYGVLTHVEVNI